MTIFSKKFSVIGSLYSMIITFELRSSISAQDIQSQNQKFSALYQHPSGSKALDDLQQFFMCCGGMYIFFREIGLIFFREIFFFYDF